jgi:type IV fimbrial biogenesis protein FimT
MRMFARCRPWPATACSRAVHRGFTLIELLIAVAIMTFLALLAVPMYGEMIANTEIRTAAGSILDGLHKAQAAAIRYNAPATFKLESDGTTYKWTVAVLLPEKPDADDQHPDLILASCATDAAGQWCPMAPYSFRAGASRATVSATGTVTFNAFGQMLRKNLDDTNPLTSVDVSTGAISSPHNLRVLVGTELSGTAMKLCDPAYDATDPMGCPTT